MSFIDFAIKVGYPNPDNYLDFRYKIVRIWEQSPQVLLAGGLGTLPLAPISKVTENEVREVARQMEARFEQESPKESRDLEAAAYILLGLRFPKEMIGKILTGVRKMKESVTYQAIFEEGEARGERNLLLRMASKKLGAPSPKTLQVLEAISDLQSIDQMGERLFDVSSWDDLLAGLH